MPLSYHHAPEGVFEATLLPGDVCHEAQQWPACDYCREPIQYGRRIVGLPRSYRPSFVLHGGCWDALQGREATHV